MVLCAGADSAGSFICTVNNPAAGTWDVMFEGVSNYHVTVEAMALNRR